MVVAGHAASGVNNDIESLKFTKAYLLTFENEVEKSKDSSELIVAMKGHDPELGLLPALEIGAKVVTGEMAW